MKKTDSSIAAFLALCMFSIGLFVSSESFAAQGFTVDIHGPGQKKVNLVQLQPRSLAGGSLTPNAAKLEQMIAGNLSYLPFLSIVPASTVLGADQIKGVTATEIDFKPFQLARIDVAITAGWKGRDVQLRAYETFSGRRLLGKAYSDVDIKNMAKVADRFCSLFVEAMTGKKGFFNSPVAFVRRVGKNKEIFSVLPQGRELKQLTRLGGINLGPDWSKDGSRIAFTHIADNKHYLGIFDSRTGKSSLKSKGLGTTIISPAYMDDGSISLTLNKTGSTDIYLLGRDYRPIRPIVHSRHIDVSPSFDRSGRKMAFTSGRFGNPHIFLYDTSIKEIKRVTFDGKYNTHPCLSPDGRYVVFARQKPGGHKIFVHDLFTGQERQLTFGRGSDEDPAFGPDGYFIAFSSNRSGQYKIYLTTRHGDSPKMLSTGPGDASSPAWNTAVYNQ